MGDNADEETASPSLNPNLSTAKRRRARSAEDYADGILSGDRAMLSRAITLVESTRPAHREQARAILDRCLPATGNAVRVAVTGVPGAGKSTFIDALGTRLAERGRTLAVLTVDPSSERSGGSILGDKTRMSRLAAHENAYIRPSPTGGALGGVAPATREAILLCETAGFDIVFVETVGVGQSEVDVHSMVDVVLLLVLAGAGDALQHVKRGIVETADLVAVNKADGPSKEAAEQVRSAYERALQFFAPPASGWPPEVCTCSARTGDGLDDVWNAAERYLEHVHKTGFFTENRREQARRWMHQTIERRLRDDFYGDPDVQAYLDSLETSVADGTLSALTAARKLLHLYREEKNST